MSVRNIRILVNFDDGNEKFKESLVSKRFDIDSRAITTIGIDNSADSLTEYDAIILSNKEPMIYIPDRVEQILNFLHQENKLFIWILNKQKENKFGDSNTTIMGELVNRLGGNANEFIYPVPSGSNFKVTEEAKRNVFYKYLNTKTKSWKISFRSKKYNFIIPLAINADGNYVSFSLKNDQIKAHNAFLPWLVDGEKIYWQTVSNFLIEKKQDYQDVSEWVFSYSFNNLNEMNRKIEKKKENILQLENERIKLEKEKKNYERIRNVLLYHDGDILKEVCKEVFNELGINAQDGKQGREDLVFDDNGSNFLIEVKGCEKSTNKGHIKQVNSHISEYENDNEVKVKGILLINAWRKLSLKERDLPDKPVFPNEIMKLVSLTSIALMTTQQLFVAYCENLEGKFNLNSFISCLKNTKGVVEGYKNIDVYRVENHKDKPNQ